MTKSNAGWDGAKRKKELVLLLVESQPTLLTCS
jgi:hypothetical protein